jgi:perosamine synthetase
MNYKVYVAKPDIGKKELQNITTAVKSGWVSSKGPYIEAFEDEFSKYVGTKHGISTSNGTTALHLALVALNIGKGDKVLVPSLTFIAVANAVTYVGATPVFVDSHPKYWCMDPSDIEKKIDQYTKAIIVVHLYGHPCDMDPIMQLAKTHNISIIEDCAEAHGAEYKGRKVGLFGKISCFSFYGNKIITTGEGGICLTDSEDLAIKIKMLRDHGMNPNKKYWHEVVGFNYRMTNLQAALGVAQLERIDSLLKQKKDIASMYNDLLKNLPNVEIAPEEAWARNVYWLYSVLLKKVSRENVMEHLAKQGFETRPFFYPIHILPPYKTELKLPVAEELSRIGMNLPSGYCLKESEIRDVVGSLKSVLTLNS